jgi:hypothetical protein
LGGNPINGTGDAEKKNDNESHPTGYYGFEKDCAKISDYSGF